MCVSVPKFLSLGVSFFAAPHVETLGHFFAYTADYPSLLSTFMKYLMFSPLNATKDIRPTQIPFSGDVGAEAPRLLDRTTLFGQLQQSLRLEENHLHSRDLASESSFSMRPTHRKAIHTTSLQDVFSSSTAVTQETGKKAFNLSSSYGRSQIQSWWSVSSSTVLKVEDLHFVESVSTPRYATNALTLIVVRYADWLTLITQLSSDLDTTCFQLEENIKFQGLTAVALWSVGSSPRSAAFSLPETDIYSAVLLRCRPAAVPGALYGQVYLQNYYGYLSGIEAPKLIFSAISSLFFGSCLVYWSILLVIKRTQVFTPHVIIECLLVVSFVSSFAWFRFYQYWNTKQKLQLPSLLLALVSGSAKKSLSLVLFLLASSGCGTIVNALTTLQRRMLLLFFVAYASFDALRQWLICVETGTIDALPFPLLFLSSFPLFLLHGIFIFCCYISFTTLRRDVHQRQQRRTYRRILSFFYLFLLFTTISVFLSIARVFFSILESVGKNWYEWVLTSLIPEGVFALFYLSLILAWKPSIEWLILSDPPRAFTPPELIEAPFSIDVSDDTMQPGVCDDRVSKASF